MCTRSRTSPAAASPATSRACSPIAATRSSARDAGKSRGSSREIQRAGDVGTDEMEHVFNLGLGMLAVVAARRRAGTRSTSPARQDTTPGWSARSSTAWARALAGHKPDAAATSDALRRVMRRRSRCRACRSLVSCQTRCPRRRSRPRLCTTTHAPVRTGALTDPQIRELSGLAASRTYAGCALGAQRLRRLPASVRVRPDGCLAGNGERVGREGDRLGRHRRRRHDAVRRRHRRQHPQPSFGHGVPRRRARASVRSPPRRRRSCCGTPTARTTPRR